MGRLTVDVEEVGLEGLPRAWGTLGQEPTKVKQTFTVYAPVLQSPTNLNKQVDQVVDRINATSWEVTSFAVRSGDQFKAIPLLPAFLQPTVQIIKFVVRRKDGAPTSKEAAIATVQAAAIKQGITLQSFKDWFVEVKDEVIAPSIPTLPKAGNVVCQAIENFTGIGCKKVLVGTGIVVGLFFAWPVISPLLGAGSRGLARRLSGLGDEVSRRRKRIERSARRHGILTTPRRLSAAARAFRRGKRRASKFQREMREEYEMMRAEAS